MHSRNAITTLFLLAILANSLLTCSGGTQKRGYTEEVVDGLRVRTYLSAEPPRIDPFVVTPAMIYGSNQSEDTYLLSSAYLQGTAKSGLLVVSDGRSSRFHLFAPDGTHQGEFGRSGQGPGEFSRRSQFLFDGTHIHIFDRSLNRQTLLDLEGNLVSIRRYPDDFISNRVARPIAFVGTGTNRFYLCELKLRASMTNTFTFRIALRDTSLALIETPIDSVYSPGVVIVGVDSRHFPIVHGWPESALASDLPVAWSWGQEFLVNFLDVITGDRWTVQIPHEALPVTSEHRENYLTRYYSREGTVEEARRKLPWPSHFPHLESMKWDTVGRLWVQEYRDPLDEEAPWIYQVFDTDGTWLFQQELPIRIGTVVEYGMYVSEYDETDNSIIRFYRFTQENH